MARLPLPRYSLFLRLLSLSLVLGALYDFVFAGLMLFAPDVPARIFHLPLPGESFYLWLIAILLSMLGALYLYAAYDPRSYRGNIVVAICGRLAGAFAMVLAARGRSDLAGLYPLAIGDFTFAVLHTVFWWPIRR